ncbi:MAG TPA: hypothetical protein VJ352_04390 [Geodermatophilus sp.]|nr:hypothetical protein [Geodermatophilus sp.]
MEPLTRVVGPDVELVPGSHRVTGRGGRMARADLRDVVPVTGEGPHTALGGTDHRRPHVRPDRQGGCARCAAGPAWAP